MSHRYPLHKRIVRGVYFWSKRQDWEEKTINAILIGLAILIFLMIGIAGKIEFNSLYPHLN